LGGGKKMRKHILILVLATFALVAVVGAAAAEGRDGGFNNYTPFNWVAGKDTVSGLVERTDNGIAIVSNDGHKYMVSGKDLSNYVGKKVAATGELSTAGGNDTIAVSSYQTCLFC